MTSGSLHDTRLLEVDGSQEEWLVRRLVELYGNGPQFRSAAAQGEFVAVTNLEAVYAGAPLVRQIFVYATVNRQSCWP
jgi:hypothetical protein